MAEGWARHLLGEHVDVRSAGLEAHGLNPRAVAVMAEAGVDISSQTSDVVSDRLLDGVGLVVTVCGHADEHCPVLPPGTPKLHWPLPDPAKLTGRDDEVMAGFRAVRDNIRARVDGLADHVPAA